MGPSPVGADSPDCALLFLPPDPDPLHRPRPACVAPGDTHCPQGYQRVLGQRASGGPRDLRGSPNLGPRTARGRGRLETEVLNGLPTGVETWAGGSRWLLVLILSRTGLPGRWGSSPPSSPPPPTWAGAPGVGVGPRGRLRTTRGEPWTGGGIPDAIGDRGGTLDRTSQPTGPSHPTRDDHHYHPLKTP